MIEGIKHSHRSAEHVNPAFLGAIHEIDSDGVDFFGLVRDRLDG
jgi:hypothetical protein